MHKKNSVVAFLGLGLILLGSFFGSLLACDEDLGLPQPPEEQHLSINLGETDLAAVDAPVYRPPRRGAPAVRISGSTRGNGDIWPTVCVIVPEHTGLTTMAQPSLFWYLSESTVARFEFALIDDQSITPILEIDLDPTRQTGVHRLRLSEHGIVLSPGVEYQWSVALVPDPKQRSNDIIASGRIERAKPSRRLASQLGKASREELPYIYARAGFWYDTLSALSNLIETKPTEARLREHRATLLEQVGLAEVAAYERQQIP